MNLLTCGIFAARQSNGSTKFIQLFTAASLLWVMPKVSNISYAVSLGDKVGKNFIRDGLFLIIEIYPFTLHLTYMLKKSFTVLTLMAILVGVMFYAGINGIMNGHSTGPLFIFVGLCTGAGLTLDIIKAVKERGRKDHLRKLRP